MSCAQQAPGSHLPSHSWGPNPADGGGHLRLAACLPTSLGPGESHSHAARQLSHPGSLPTPRI